jgi:hypothetical protein
MENSIRRLVLRMIPAVVLLSLSGCAATGAGRYSSPDAEIRGTLLEQQWGVRPLYIRLTAEGLMLDFRYRVLDAEKAAPLFELGNKAYLVDQATGAKFLVPESRQKSGPSHHPAAEPDRNYFIIFANPGRYVKKGTGLPW